MFFKKKEKSQPPQTPSAELNAGNASSPSEDSLFAPSLNPSPLVFSIFEPDEYDVQITDVFQPDVQAPAPEAAWRTYETTSTAPEAFTPPPQDAALEASWVQPTAELTQPPSWTPPETPIASALWREIPSPQLTYEPEAPAAASLEDAFAASFEAVVIPAMPTLQLQDETLYHEPLTAETAAFYPLEDLEAGPTIPLSPVELPTVPPEAILPAALYNPYTPISSAVHPEIVPQNVPPAQAHRSAAPAFSEPEAFDLHGHLNHPDAGDAEWWAAGEPGTGPEALMGDLSVFTPVEPVTMTGTNLLGENIQPAASILPGLTSMLDTSILISAEDKLGDHFDFQLEADSPELMTPNEPWHFHTSNLLGATAPVESQASAPQADPSITQLPQALEANIVELPPSPARTPIFLSDDSAFAFEDFTGSALSDDTDILGLQPLPDTFSDTGDFYFNDQPLDPALSGQPWENLQSLDTPPGTQVPPHAGHLLDDLNAQIYPASPFDHQIGHPTSDQAYTGSESAFEEAAGFLFPETAQAPLEWEDYSYGPDSGLTPPAESFPAIQSMLSAESFYIPDEELSQFELGASFPMSQTGELGPVPSAFAAPEPTAIPTIENRTLNDPQNFPVYPSSDSGQESGTPQGASFQDQFDSLIQTTRVDYTKPPEIRSQEQPPTLPQTSVFQMETPEMNPVSDGIYQDANAIFWPELPTPEGVLSGYETTGFNDFEADWNSAFLPEDISIPQLPIDPLAAPVNTVSTWQDFDPEISGILPEDTHLLDLEALNAEAFQQTDPGITTPLSGIEGFAVLDTAIHQPSNDVPLRPISPVELEIRALQAPPVELPAAPPQASAEAVIAPTPLVAVAPPIVEPIFARPEPVLPTEKLDILGVCSIDANKRLLLINNDDVIALLGQVGTDNNHLRVLKIFDTNPIAFQNTFTAVREARPDRQGLFMVQVGLWRGIVSSYGDSLSLYSELG